MGDSQRIWWPIVSGCLAVIRPCMTVGRAVVTRGPRGHISTWTTNPTCLKARDKGDSRSHGFYLCDRLGPVLPIQGCFKKKVAVIGLLRCHHWPRSSVKKLCRVFVKTLPSSKGFLRVYSGREGVGHHTPSFWAYSSAFVGRVCTPHTPPLPHPCTLEGLYH